MIVISSYYNNTITVLRYHDTDATLPGYAVSGEATVYRARVSQSSRPVRNQNGETTIASYTIRTSADADILTSDKIVLTDISSTVVSGDVGSTATQWSPILVVHASDFGDNHLRVVI